MSRLRIVDRDPQTTLGQLRKAGRRLARAGYRGAAAAGRRALGHGPGAVPTSRRAPGRAAWPDPTKPPWEPLPAGTGVLCPVCRWRGPAFEGGTHVELSFCSACGGNGRDRFLLWCLIERVDLHAGLRVIDVSPRLGRAYREAMSTWFFYRTTDFDQRAYKGGLHLDLQDIALPDGCVDVMLCSHVLEHVPDTDAALAEVRRVLAPGGHLLLQVPVLQGRTTRPTGPELHGDETPVLWRFGFDLTDRLRRHGFVADLLCTRRFLDAVTACATPWPEWSSEFDLPDMIASAVPSDLVSVADECQARRHGFEPAYMFLTWDCAVPTEDPTPRGAAVHAAGTGRSTTSPRARSTS